MDTIQPTQTPSTQGQSSATNTLKVLVEGKNQRLTQLVPEGQSPRLYIELLKEQVMRTDGDDAHLLYFMYVCKRVGLDPLARQIYAVFRNDSRSNRKVMTIQSGIDGFRLVAQRTGEYAGQDDIKFTPEDEATKYPTKATCTVYRVVGGRVVAFTASARWNEYCQLYNGKPSNLWEKMPYLMLGKCAEALALRKAFPNELSGIYTTEEMAQAGNADTTPTPSLPEKPQPVKVPEKADGAVGQPGVVAGLPGATTKAETEAPKEPTPPVEEKKNEVVNELWHKENGLNAFKSLCESKETPFTTNDNAVVTCPKCLKMISVLHLK